MPITVKQRCTPSGVCFFTMDPLAADGAPLLLLFAVEGRSTLETTRYRRIGEVLHAFGWNVVSLDLPCHGPDRRESEPEGLPGWAARIRAGEDIVVELRKKAEDVVQHLIATKQADPNYIVAAGTSRGGFMAIQVAAAIPQIRAIVGFAPVTDLAALSEFQGQEGSPLVQRLALKNLAESLSNRALWIAIGNADQRVGTDKAMAFASAVMGAAVKRNLPSQVTLHVLAVPGHSSLSQWHDDAALWLQKTLT